MTKSGSDADRREDDCEHCLFIVGVLQDSAGEITGYDADQDREEDHDRNHIQRHCAGRYLTGNERVDRKEDDDADNVIEDRHRQQCIGDGAVGMVFLGNRKGRCRRSRKGDASEGEAEPGRNTLNQEDDGKGCRYDEEGAQRLGQRRNHEGSAVFLELFPYKFGPEHEADGDLQHLIQDAVPAAVKDRLRKQVEDMGTQNHSADEPAKNGRHMDLCHEAPQQEGASQCC